MFSNVRGRISLRFGDLGRPMKLKVVSSTFQVVILKFVMVAS